MKAWYSISVTRGRDFLIAHRGSQRTPGYVRSYVVVDGFQIPEVERGMEERANGMMHLRTGKWWKIAIRRERMAVFRKAYVAGYEMVRGLMLRTSGEKRRKLAHVPDKRTEPI